jgi:hypothetical protein
VRTAQLCSAPALTEPVAVPATSVAMETPSLAGAATTGAGADSASASDGAVSAVTRKARLPARDIRPMTMSMG